jgi:hypothetical protein
MGRQLVLLAGIPAAGKTFFSRWAERHRSFLHLNVETDGPYRCPELRPVWPSPSGPRDVTPLAHAMRALDRDIILDWGFPVRCFSTVQAFKNLGFALWWFDADRDQARRAYLRRAGGPATAFDRQVADIAREWATIRPVFEPNIITTLSADGTRMAPELLYAKMFGDATPPETPPAPVREAATA